MRRPWIATAGLTAAASFGALLSVAGPAQAKCGPAPIDDVLEAGYTIAIVTRTDKGGSPAALRVEAFAGPEPPATVSATTDRTAECQSYVGPGKVAAVALHRADGEWVLGGSGFDLGQAFARAQGAPVAVGGGPIVAYAAGNFGGARLAGLDREGRTVAWGGGYGHGDQVAACPGGSTVVVFGRPPAKSYAGRVGQLTVHDAATLKVRRTVRVPFGGYGTLMALHCRDAEARRVDVLTEVSVGRAFEDRGRLLTVDGTRVRRADLPPVQAAVATFEGFIAAVGADDASLIRIRRGRTRTLAQLSGTVYSIVGAIGSLAVAPDESAAAFTLHSRRSAGTSIVTVDLRTGERLGSSTPRGQFVTGLAWVGPRRLLVRDTPFRGLPMRLLDNRARPVGTWPRAEIPNNQGSRLSALGGDALVYGWGRRLTVIPRSGTPFVARSLRLAAAAHIVAVPGARFAAGAERADGGD